MDEKANEKDSQLKAINTYQADVERALKEKNISTTQVFVAEQKKKNQETAEYQKNVSTTPRSFNLRAILFALIFVIIGGIGIYYFVITPKTEVVQKASTPTKTEDSIITYDSYLSLDFTENNRVSLINTINTNEVSYTTPGIEILSFGTTTSDKFLSLLDPNLSGIFLRSLDPQYAFGLIRVQDATSTKPFVVLKVSTYTSTRGSLLSEEGNMIYKISDVFSIPNNFTLHFKDLVINNQDTRALVDDKNNIYFVYSFIDPQTLVFAPDDVTFKIIIDRIAATKR